MVQRYPGGQPVGYEPTLDGTEIVTVWGLNPNDSNKPRTLSQQTSTAAIAALSGATVTLTPSGEDDTAAFQAAIDRLSQANGGRGGTIQLAPGIFEVSASLDIQNQGNIRIQGPSPCTDQIANNAVPSTSYQYGAATINYSGTAATACFVVTAEGPADGWATIGVVFENFAIVGAASTTDGILLAGSDNDVGIFQYDIYFKGCFIGGGRYGVHATGNNAFNIFIDSLEIGVYRGMQPDWGIYSELTHGPGIACCWKNLRIVHTNIGHIYLGGITFDIELDNCTLEACGQSSIVAPASVGQLVFTHCHWEQVGNSAHWNGTYYQNSVSDNTPVAPIVIGSVLAGNTVSNISIDDCSINTKVIGGIGNAEVLPIVLAYDSSIVRLDGGFIGPIGTGLSQGQPYLRRDGFETALIMEGVQCEPMAAGVLPVGGSQTNGGLRQIRISNCSGLLAYPLVQPTNGNDDFDTNDFAAVGTNIVRLLAAQTDGSLALLPARKEMYIPDVTWLATPNIARYGPFNEGDTLWLANPTELGQPTAFICTANNVTTYTAAQWLASLLQPKALQSILPGYSASMTFDLTGGEWFPIQVTDGNPFTINAPIHGGIGGQELEVTIQNISGGALGLATWNAVFRMRAWTQPANAFNRTIRFRIFAANWIEMSRTEADVNN